MRSGRGLGRWHVACPANDRDVLRDRYRVTIAANASDALCSAAVDHPDLILLGLGLEGVAGGDALAQMYRFRGGHTPIVVVSGRPDAREVAERIGATGLVAKPFRLEDLEVAVERSLQRRLAAPMG